MNTRELSIIADASGGEIASPASQPVGDCEEPKAMRKSRLSGTSQVHRHNWCVVNGKNNTFQLDLRTSSAWQPAHRRQGERSCHPL
jgi:hypothetical protein